MEKQSIQVSQVYQTDFSPSKGNALQACIASILQQENLHKVPNFIEHPNGYFEGIKQFFLEQKLNISILKLPVDVNGILQNQIEIETDTICLVRGKSPRGDFAHVIVGKIDQTKKQAIPVFDPHPEGNNLDGFKDGKGWILQNLISFDYEVFGKVQGVYFRKYTEQQANKLGLVGWVMNTQSGTVVGTIQGKQAEAIQMEEWLKNTGSPMSKIEKFEKKNEKTIQNLEYKNFEFRKK